ncbi:MAG TPA: tetratricopeptide repeat protein [Luteibaculaceae bacterium]|nr:tetratricopeptide repeat protein [Luteibaculaceae bacterium]
MKKVIVPIFALFCLVGACKQEATTKESPQTEIDAAALPETEQLALILKNNEALVKSTSPDSILFLANAQIKTCDAFLAKYLTSGSGVEVMKCKANACRAAGKFAEAVTVYNQIESRYNTYDSLGDIIFTRAFILDNELNAKEEARDAYNKLINRFPNHPYSADAKALLEQLYMSDEELIQQLKAKNKQK